MRIHGEVFLDTEKIGVFTVYGDDQLVVTPVPDEDRMTAYQVFKWAQNTGKTLMFTTNEDTTRME